MTHTDAGTNHRDHDPESDRRDKPACERGRIRYRGANGEWYDSQEEAARQYTWSRKDD